MKLKKLSILLIVYICCILSSCSLSHVEGEELIEKARDAYTSLDSAHVEVVNADTGETEQEFIFRYDEKDYLTYYYYGRNGDEIYQQFNNAFEQFTNDRGELSYLIHGQKKFQRYMRGERLTYAYADRGLILFQKSAVDEATVEEVDGKTVVTHTYDVKKLSGAEDVAQFSVVYYFNPDGTLDTFYENTVSTSGDRFSYRVVISQKNEIERVPCPFKLDNDGNIALVEE